MRHGRIHKLVEICSAQRPGLMSETIIAYLSQPVAAKPSSVATQTAWRFPELERLLQRVDHLVIEAPIDWLRGIALVDTPGTADLLTHFDEHVRSYVQKADSLIYVTSALAPVSESEQGFLRTAIPARDFPKILFVVNRMDEMRDERSAHRLLMAARARIFQIFPDAPVFGLSALHECCRVQGEVPPQPALAGILEANFDRFRAFLQESILLNRDLIHLDRSASAAEQMVAEFEMSVLKLRQALDNGKSLTAPAAVGAGTSTRNSTKPSGWVSRSRPWPTWPAAG